MCSVLVGICEYKATCISTKQNGILIEEKKLYIFSILRKGNECWKKLYKNKSSQMQCYVFGFMSRYRMMTD